LCTKQNKKFHTIYRPAGFFENRAVLEILLTSTSSLLLPKCAFTPKHRRNLGCGKGMGNAPPIFVMSKNILWLLSGRAANENGNI